MNQFEQINRAFNDTFHPGELSLGIVIPIENYAGTPVPAMADHLDRVQLVEELGFKAVWVRDVPLHVPSFGDAGQTFDPFTYLGFLAGKTSHIALGIASVALPLHHPIHVAKSAATIDQLSGGRLLMGIASGDRPSEYPALGISFDNRAEKFRDAYHFIRASHDDFPSFQTDHYGQMDGTADILPKPINGKIPLLVTGHSRQTIEWIAEYGDGWMYYPRSLHLQELNIREWRALIGKTSNNDKPFMQSLYVDLHQDDDFQPQGIHLGFRLGANHLIDYLSLLKEIGVNHVALNLRFNAGDMPETLERIASKVLPHFNPFLKSIAK